MSEPAMHVAYLITHYPSPSHTFIYGEIQAARELGVTISPLSINAVGADDLLSDEDRSESARTFYVKSVPRRTILTTLLGYATKHPASLVRTVRLAVTMAGWDLHAVLWHVFHVVEAVVVLRHCERIGATHLHSHFGGLPSTVALYASELSSDRGERRLSWSVSVHGFHEFTNERHALLRQKVLGASFVACVSDFTRSQLMRIVGDAQRWPNIHVVRCGIDLARFRFEPHAPSPALRILITARVVAEKGLGVLLDAVAMLVQRGVMAEVVVIGDGPARSSLADRAAEIGLTERVQWLGFQPPAEVLRWLREADVFCLPSFAEGLPIVLMEAMAVGVPVVSTYLGGIPELVQNGVTGRLVPAGRSDLLAAAIQDLGESSADRDDMVKAARQRVEELHEIHRSAGQLVDLFRTSARTLVAT
jgi:colanic acid/amylovoran biosynthesis glycosyltransferase